MLVLGSGNPQRSEMLSSCISESMADGSTVDKINVDLHSYDGQPPDSNISISSSSRSSAKGINEKLVLRDYSHPDLLEGAPEIVKEGCNVIVLMNAEVSAAKAELTAQNIDAAAAPFAECLIATSNPGHKAAARQVALSLVGKEHWSLEEVLGSGTGEDVRAPDGVFPAGDWLLIRLVKVCPESTGAPKGHAPNLGLLRDSKYQVRRGYDGPESDTVVVYALCATVGVVEATKAVTKEGEERPGPALLEEEVQMCEAAKSRAEAQLGQLAQLSVGLEAPGDCLAAMVSEMVRGPRSSGGPDPDSGVEWGQGSDLPSDQGAIYVGSSWKPEGQREGQHNKAIESCNHTNSVVQAAAMAAKLKGEKIGYQVIARITFPAGTHVSLP